MNLTTDSCYVAYRKTENQRVWSFYTTISEAYTACHIMNDELERYLKVHDPENPDKRPFEVLTLQDAIIKDEERNGIGIITKMNNNLLKSST